MLILVAVAVCYLVWDAYFRNKEEKPISEEKGNVEVVERKDDKQEDKKDEPETEVFEKEKVVQYDGDDPNEADELTGVITYAGVVGGILRIRVNIDQYLSSGDCVLSMKQNGVEIYGDEAIIIDSASTATCEGFDVRVELLNVGSTEIVITLKSGERTGVIRGEVTI